MSKVKYRCMWAQVFYMMITFGFYSVYWFYQTATELKMLAKDEEASPTLWTILLFVPLGNIFAFYKYSELYEKICTEKLSKWLLFVLWIVFNPAIWFLAQKDLNQVAKSQTES